MTKPMEKVTRLSLKKIDLIVYDFDGVMTDNRVLVLQDGREAVYCNRSDGLGANMIKKLGIPQIIISTESNPVVEARAKKIGLQVLHDCENKLETLQSFCAQNNYKLSKVLYVGNDTNDLDVMKAVGMPICPADAHPSILKLAILVLKTRGGYGVVRELADILE